MTESDKYQKMKLIRDEIMELTDSPLFKERLRNEVYPVIGEGDYDADLMFVGEAPGKNEAQTGLPFCGAAGRILDEMLVSIAVSRSSVYVTNIVKDRPPNNRDPSPQEIDQYAPFLDRQIEIVRPRIIATLGRFSMKYILERYGEEPVLPSISEAHGRAYRTQVSYGRLFIFPLYHPAVAIYNRNQKSVLLADMAKLKEYYQNSIESD